MTGGPTSDDIVAAIRSSGYLMEQEVASSLEAAGYHVRTNVPFEDPDEGKSRELDVAAINRIARDETNQLAAYMEILVECKNSTNPFVFITRPKNSADDMLSPQEFIFPYQYTARRQLIDGRQQLRDLSAIAHLGIQPLMEDYTNRSKAVQFCRVDRDAKGWKANHGGLYDAMFYPMAKALTARQKEIPRPRNQGDWRYFWFFFPIVVTSGDLFVLDSTVTTPSPTPVDYVTFRRELKGGKTSGAFRLTFVRQSALEHYLTEIVDPIAARITHLIENEGDLIRNTDAPWVD